MVVIRPIQGREDEKIQMMLVANVDTEEFETEMNRSFALIKRKKCVVIAIEHVQMQKETTQEILHSASIYYQ